MSTTTAITSDTREKLLDLISIIEKVPDAEWDMDVWRDADYCGTVGCAAYHYTRARPNSGLSVYGHGPRFGDSFGFCALGKYFGITPQWAGRLFLAACYPDDGHAVTRQQVIDRIREFLGDQL